MHRFTYHKASPSTHVIEKSWCPAIAAPHYPSTSLFLPTWETKDVNEISIGKTQRMRGNSPTLHHTIMNTTSIITTTPLQSQPHILQDPSQWMGYVLSLCMILFFHDHFLYLCSASIAIFKFLTTSSEWDRTVDRLVSRIWWLSAVWCMPRWLTREEARGKFKLVHRKLEVEILAG